MYRVSFFRYLARNLGSRLAKEVAKIQRIAVLEDH